MIITCTRQLPISSDQRWIDTRSSRSSLSVRPGAITNVQPSHPRITYFSPPSLFPCTVPLILALSVLFFALFGRGHLADSFRTKIAEFGGRGLLPCATAFAGLIVSLQEADLRYRSSITALLQSSRVSALIQVSAMVNFRFHCRAGDECQGQILVAVSGENSMLITYTAPRHLPYLHVLETTSTQSTLLHWGESAHQPPATSVAVSECKLTLPRYNGHW